MIDLQSVISQRSTQEQTTTNIMNSLNSSQSAVAKNIGGGSGPGGGSVTPTTPASPQATLTSRTAPAAIPVKRAAPAPCRGCEVQRTLKSVQKIPGH
jgi:hypothetical protein